MIDKETRILVADDSQVVRKNTSIFLKNLGYEKVREAWDGESALLKIFDAHEEGDPFGLVLCDVTMPRLSGKDVLHKLREDERFKGIPFVFITALGREEEINKGYQAGADRYLVKPYTQEQIETLLLEL